MAYNSTGGLTLSHGKPNNYALNGEIMLCSVIVIFLVVALIACFHSYARSCFRCRNSVRRSSSPPNQTTLPVTTGSSIAGNQGLSLSLLETLPTFIYPIRRLPLLQCAVCFSEFESGERGRVLPKCNHSFHVNCIDMWFKSQSNCPICRAPVEKSDILIRQQQNSFEMVIVGTQDDTYTEL